MMDDICPDDTFPSVNPYTGKLPSQYPNRDEHQSTESVTKVTATSIIVELIKKEPDYRFTILEVAERTGIDYDTVKAILHRLSSPKNPAPIKRVDHGLYQQDPTKCDDRLSLLVHSHNWRTENITLVTKGAYPVSQNPECEDAVCQKKDSRSRPKAGYPWILPTGQKVSWDIFSNGTQVIHLSANKRDPFNPELVLLLLDGLNLDSSWKCTRMELNLDSKYHHVDFCLTMEVLKGLLLKCYQHGQAMRIELVDCRTVSLKEAHELFTGLVQAAANQAVLRECSQLRKELNVTRKDVQFAVNLSRKALDRASISLNTSNKPESRKRKRTPTPSSDQIERNSDLSEHVCEDNPYIGMPFNKLKWLIWNLPVEKSEDVLLLRQAFEAAKIEEHRRARNARKREADRDTETDGE